TSLVPAAGARLNTSVSEIVATLNAGTGSPLNLAGSNITVTNAAGTAATGTLETDETTGVLRLRLNAPLASAAQNGTYTVAVNALDRAGNRLTRTVSLTLDTVAPSIAEMTSGGGIVLRPGDSTIVLPSTATLTAPVTETGSGVNFAGVGATLTSPTGANVALSVSDAANPTRLIISYVNLNEDGIYRLTITGLSDLVGNTAQNPTFSFAHDRTAPQIVSLTPLNIASGTSTRVNAQIESLVLTLQDTFSDIDFDATTIVVARGGATVPGALDNNRDNIVTLRLNSPLARDGSADGTYTATVTAVDTAGNARAQTFTFIYDTQPPTVASTEPAGGATVSSALSQVNVTLNDSASGVDLAGSVVTLIGPNGNPVTTAASAVGTSGIRLSFVPLRTDGAADGTYRIDITARDLAGNSATVLREFTLLTGGPRVLSTTPGDGSYVTKLTTVSATLVDESGTGIDFDATTITVADPSGAEVAGRLSNDTQNTVTFTVGSPLPADGSVDGTYTITIRAVDRRGAARVTTRTVGLVTVPATVAEVTPANKSFTSALDSVTVRFENATADSTVELRDPSGSVMSGARVWDNGTLTFTPAVVPVRDGRDDGIYTINVVPANVAGPATVTRTFTFTFDTQVPTLTTVSGVDTNAAVSFATGAIPRINVTTTDATSGMNFPASSVHLLDASGAEVPGSLANNNVDSIWWLLANPLTPGGASDGEYTVEIAIADRAGNVDQRSFAVVYDSLAPTVVSSIPEANTPLSTVISEATVELTDAGSGVDLAASQLSLVAPNGSTVGVNRRISGNSVTLQFASLTQPGTYTINVTGHDRAGNVAEAPTQIPFSISLGLPSVATLNFGGAPIGSFVRSLSEIRATLSDPSGAGLNMAEGGSSIVVTRNGAPISARTTADGNTLIWRPTIPLATNGADDGQYTITVTPVDSRGRAGAALTQQFVYDSQAPRIVSTSPIDINQSSNFVGAAIPLGALALEATLADDGASGLDMNAQTITVTRANGTALAGRLTSDGQSIIRFRLNSPLPTDGSADGTYTLTIRALDRAGNETVAAMPLIYDTLAPTLVSSVPEAGSTVSTTNSVITLNLNDTGGSGIDLSGSAVTLTAPNGDVVNGTANHNGVNQIQFVLDGNLTQIGTHTLALALRDRAGNTRNVQLTYFHAATIPTIVRTEPTTFPTDLAFAPSGLDEVSAQLQATAGGGISLSPAHSEIRLTDSTGNTVPGTQQSSGTDTLVYRLSRPLADDGSDDGTYNIVVTPANLNGQRGQTRTYTFTYDSRPPRVVSTLATLFPNGGAPGSVAGFQIAVSDPSPASGIDWLAVDNTWMTLEDPNGNALPGVVESDGSAVLQLLLAVPLASDGTQDGVYAVVVSPQDRSGNATAVRIEFDLDTKAPVIDPTSLLLNEQPLVVDTSSLAYPSATNKESGVAIRVTITDDGAGTDLARSTMTLTSPNGEQIAGTMRQNGFDTLEFVSGALSSEGVYRVTIKALGADLSGLGIQPESTLGAAFLFEKTPPTASITSGAQGGIFENEPAYIAGTATDPSAEGGGGVSASGVASVEIGGTGPDGAELDWELAKDDSGEQQNPWAQWSNEFLPSRSGKFRVAARVTDKAGNSNIVDVGTFDFTTSLSFKGPVYAWPNPLSHARGDVAHFSFETNQAENATVTLSIFDVSGALVSYKQFAASRDRLSNSQSITWNLANDAASDVASGIYVFRLELNDGQSTERRMGRILVVK
ncbi:MAG: Ig-like domain-containing protein, partial [Candidatus Poribacteria bacterium]|nr:Ig-like domain-containing protein [Candidatus Poribacteria bacterium]